MSSSVGQSSNASTGGVASDSTQGTEDNLSGTLWKYVTKEFGEGRVGGGNFPFVCNICKKNFKGSHSRVKAHLLKIPNKGLKACTKVTRAQMDEMCDLVLKCEEQLGLGAPRSVPLPPSSSRVESGTSYFPLDERDNDAKKRKGAIVTSFRVEDRKECDAEVARMFYTSGLPFNLARNPRYRSSYTKASKIPGYVPPGYNALRTTLLQNEKSHIERMLQPIKKTWKDTGVSLCSDGWTDDQRRPLINMMAASENGAIMLRAINCEGVFKDKHEISRLLIESIKEIGPENVVQVVTDNAPVCVAAGALVEAQYPHIFWSGCVVHTLNLALKDIMKAKSFGPGENVELGWLMEVVNDVWFIRTFILSHNMRNSMFNDHSSLKLLQVAETRFASHYVMLKRFRDVKSGLQQMVINPRWDMYKEDDVLRAKRVKEMLLDDKLWDHIDFIIGFMSPIYEMIRMADLDKPCLHLVYEWWDSMIEKVKNAILKPEFTHVISTHCEPSDFYDDVHAILIARWTKQSTSLHCMAHSLHPKYYTSQWLEADPNRVAPHTEAELTQERKKCLEKLYQDAQVRHKVIEEYAYFSLSMRDYSTPEALENRYFFEPLVWWGYYGSSTPLLQTLALKLLRQPCSSSCCERNWSTYSFIHGLKRNKLEPSRAQDLVFVHTNLRLLSRREASYVKDMDSMWDLGGDEHDSMAPSSVDTLDLATLSLDEPALERMIVNDES